MKASILIALAAALLPIPALAGSYQPPPIPHITSFCASGCDSTATTYTTKGAVTATYCASGGAGAGGFSGAATGAGGGGGSGECKRNYPIEAAPGTVLTFLSSAGPTGGAIGVQGVNGTANLITWTQGALAMATPVAVPGQGGATGTSTLGGAGGQAFCSISAGNASACGAGPEYIGGAGGTAGVVGPGGTGGQSSSLNGPYSFFGSAGGGGGGNSSGTGGGSRIVAAMNGGTGQINGGAATNTNTCGGGGAGGSSLYGLGGAGGSAGVGSNAAGDVAGGGGGACGFAGGNGGQQRVIIIDVY